MKNSDLLLLISIFILVSIASIFLTANYIQSLQASSPEPLVSYPFSPSGKIKDLEIVTDPSAQPRICTSFVPPVLF